MNIVSKSVVALILGCVGSVQAAEITLLTEDFSPSNFMQNGQIVGRSAEQVFEMMDRAGITYDVEMTQWSRAIRLAEVKPNTCVFTTTHTDERDPKFKWIEPLLEDSTVLIRKVGSGVAPTSVEDALSLRVGSQTGDYTADVLEKAGFLHIDLAPNSSATLRKLEEGRIDLMATSGGFLGAALAEGVAVEEALVLSKAIKSVACSLTTDQELVDRMQAALQSIIDDGTQAEVISRY